MTSWIDHAPAAAAIATSGWVWWRARQTERRRARAWQQLHQVAALVESRGTVTRDELLAIGLNPALLDELQDAAPC